jgi:hypothetical protein
MIYLRRIFTQDLRDGKQIAFPKEPSNLFFGFCYNPADSDREITFKYEQNDTSSIFHRLNGHLIKTRLYSAVKESRIDSQLKSFLRDTLNAVVDDLIVFKRIDNFTYTFQLYNQESKEFEILNSLIRTNKYHEILSTQEEIDLDNQNNEEDIILSDKTLNQIIFKSFIYLKGKFSDDILFKNKIIKDLNINNNSFKGIFLEDFFGADHLLGQFSINQSEESLKSGGVKRFFSDSIKIFENEFTYFSNQWKEEGVKSRSLSSFNNYLLSITSNDNQLEIIKRDDSYFLLSINKHNIKSTNKIYYGAPGTGKSYKVDKEIEGLDSIYFERVTFHPEFDNSSFVGGYKPISELNEKGEDIIKYKFVPQAFTNIYVRAWENDKKQYYLVIEEINRGNCAEIFGDIFQLLDRNSNYTVSPSKELREHLEIAFGDKNHEGIKDGLKLPNNLNIYATMNTSDQSLFPMDSAFKRRWEWEYVPICYTQIDDEGKRNSSFDFIIDIQNGKKYSWIKFIEQINLKHIKINPALGMDKCIGNYFIKPDNELTISLKPFINKVIFYLWNDVFKDEENSVFEDNTSYEDFFPIENKGKSKIEELFNRIELKPIAKEYTLDNESQIIQNAAEGPVQYGDEVS